MSFDDRPPLPPPPTLLPLVRRRLEGHDFRAARERKPSPSRRAAVIEAPSIRSRRTFERDRERERERERESEGEVIVARSTIIYRG